MFISATIPTTSAARRTTQVTGDSDDREGELLHPDTERRGNRRGEDLPAELLPPVSPRKSSIAPTIVARGAEQDAAQLAAERQERERRDEDAEEERETTEPRELVPRTVAFVRPSARRRWRGAADDRCSSRTIAERGKRASITALLVPVY